LRDARLEQDIIILRYQHEARKDPLGIGRRTHILSRHEGTGTYALNLGLK